MENSNGCPPLLVERDALLRMRAVEQMEMDLPISLIRISYRSRNSWKLCSRFGEMVACFRYASIDIHSVYLPPHKLDFDYENQDWIPKESDEVQYLQPWILKGLMTRTTKRPPPRDQDTTSPPKTLRH